MRKLENEEMRKWENEKMREWGNERMRKWGNEKMRKWENGVRATRKVLAEGLSVYSTLPKVVARRAINFGKVCTAKMMCWDY